jgi:dihydrolipoamide dehydrogenase
VSTEGQGTKPPTEPTREVRLPDLGTTGEVKVLELLVQAGDVVEVDTPLITLESDKATMDVPSPAAGRVMDIVVKAGDKVATGTKIMELAGARPLAAEETEVPASPRQSEPFGGEPYLETIPIRPLDPAAAGTAARTEEPARAPAAKPRASFDHDVVVIGAGPGGYTAAFRAADLGLRVALVERWPTLGGVCLNVGCIPSKALLHAAKVIDDAKAMSAHGIDFGTPQIDVPKLRDWKNQVVGRLTGGLAALAKQRKVTVLQGVATFNSEHSLAIDGADGTQGSVSFAHCIIAAGSESMRLPGLPDDPRIIDSTGALELDLPGRMLVVGGGIIGLEMATVYAALGVKVSVVELTPGLMPGCDRDLVKPLEKRIAQHYEAVMLETKVTGVEARKEGLRVTFEGARAPEPQLYDKVLVAVGRTPNGKLLNCEAAGIAVSERGFIAVDRQQRTNVPHILAIGDIVGQPMLAHKATHEAKVAAEVIAGHKRYFDARAIPSVAYTDPEIAWAGLTETDAGSRGIAYEKAVFPWAASGRSLAIGRDEGFTKLLFDPDTHRVLGGGIVGSNAGELIAEVALAIEMGADAADVGLTVHPHPTLSETVAMAAEAFDGSLTDLYLPRRTRKGKAG